MIQPDKIIRSARKTLSISIDAFGRLIVRAPKKCTEERIFAFIREKESWILRKQAEKQRENKLLPPDDLHGYEFLLLGKKTKIIVDDGKTCSILRVTDDPMDNLVERASEILRNITAKE